MVNQNIYLRIKNGFNIMLFVFIINFIFILRYIKAGNLYLTPGLKVYLMRFLFPSFSFLARDAKMPQTDRIENIMKPVLMLAISPG